MKRKILIWRPGIDDVIMGSNNVAGIPLQMSIWARIFVLEGWEVDCQTDKKKSFQIEGINFIGKDTKKIFATLHLSFVADLVFFFFILVIKKPKLLFERGPSRTTFWHALFCRVLRIKYIFFGASDINFTPGKNTLNNSKVQTWLYEKALHIINQIIVQNIYQKNSLLNNYHVKSEIIPNIWIEKANYKPTFLKEYDAIWVSNLRTLKRAEWFLEVAETYPEQKFLLVGGVIEQEYANEIIKRIKTLANVMYLGPQPVNEVGNLIAKSKVLICTSKYEGFPNSFIQAWSNGIPVISTVDPNGVIEHFNLGKVIATSNELTAALPEYIFGNESKDLKDSIRAYFQENHSAEKAYKRLSGILNIDNSYHD